jgi:hypothetical protein
MTVSSTTDFSSGLAPETEYPLTEPEPLPFFSEAFSFEAYDGDSAMGFWAYLNVPPFDFSLAREVLAVFLPDGRVLLAKAFGRGRTPTIQGGANLFFECVDPFTHWKLRYRAPALLTTAAQSLLGPVPDGVYVPIDLTIDVFGAAPIWLAGSRDAAAAAEARKLAGAHLHYNQIITTRCRLEFEGTTHQFGGSGVRDHTRGPRVVKGTNGHQFVFCTFPSGRAFGAFCNQPTDGASMGQGYVVVDGQIHHARDVELTPFTGFRPAGEPVSARFHTDLGQASIEGEMLDATGFTMVPPNEVILGADRQTPDGYFLIDGHARVTWDGETAIAIYRRGTTYDPERWAREAPAGP